MTGTLYGRRRARPVRMVLLGVAIAIAGVVLGAVVLIAVITW